MRRWRAVASKIITVSNAAPILAGLANGLLLGAAGAWAGLPMDKALAVAGSVGGL